MWRAVRLTATRSALVVVCLLLAAALGADEPYGRHLLDPAVVEHWSFQSVRRPEVPRVDGGCGNNPIDAFVLTGLTEAKLSPAGPAERATLLRRVFIDLIGIPPTPAELDAFLADASPTAYERVVDDLLSRPQYGERWARHWLDVVRYAETNGYERDGLKPQAWRFRDWVIDALNADMPYDQFLSEQLAGDEIEGSDARSQIATTMLRLGPWDDEPADPLVDRYDQLDDIVGTTSATFLGLTLRCARCHDHKFEPFSQKDYTRWQAIFAPLKRPQKDRADLDRDLGPQGEVAAYQARVKQLDAERADFDAKIAGLEYQVAQRAAAEGRLPMTPAAVVVAATSQAEGQTWRYTFDDPSNANWILADFDDSGWKSGSGGFGTQGTPGAVVRTVWSTPAIWLRREFTLAARAGGRSETAGRARRRLRGLYQRRAGRQRQRLHDRVSRVRRRPRGQSRAAFGPQRVGGSLPADHRRPGHRRRADFFAAEAGPCAADSGGQRLARRSVRGLVAEPAKRNDAQKKLLGKHADKIVAVVGELATPDERGQLEAWKKARQAAKSSYPTPLVKGYVWYEEGPQFAASHVFKRGDPRSPGDEVGPGFPAVLVDAPPAAPAATGHSTGRRLQLAALAHPADHPLTARVMVNRLWQHHFGDGIVATENDFGVMGSAPSNQPLLDWLASELVDGGWRLKQMHRLMVLSDAYQRASTPNAGRRKGRPAAAPCCGGSRPGGWRPRRCATRSWPRAAA